MKYRYLLSALAFAFSTGAFSTGAFAAEPQPMPKKDCCCCAKEKHGKMGCCKDEAAKTGGDHAGHDMPGMNSK